jgi:hypothetical protein
MTPTKMDFPTQSKELMNKIKKNWSIKDIVALQGPRIDLTKPLTLKKYPSIPHIPKDHPSLRPIIGTGNGSGDGGSREGYAGFRNRKKVDDGRTA